MEGLQEVINALSIFWVATIFLLPVSPLRPLRRPLLPYFCPYRLQPSNRYQTVQMDFLAANHVRIVGLCSQNKAHRAVIFATAQLSCIQSLTSAPKRQWRGQSTAAIISNSALDNSTVRPRGQSAELGTFRPLKTSGLLRFSHTGSGTARAARQCSAMHMENFSKKVTIRGCRTCEAIYGAMPCRVQCERTFMVFRQMEFCTCRTRP